MEDVAEGPLEVCVVLEVITAELGWPLATSFLPRAFINWEARTEEDPEPDLGYIENHAKIRKKNRKKGIDSRKIGQIHILENKKSKSKKK